MPPLTPKSDHVWWNDLKNDDPKALGHLYDTYINQLFISAMHITNDRELAKDSLQEVFIEIWHYRKTITRVDNSLSYLNKILERIIYKRLQKAKLFIVDEPLDALSQELNAEEKWIASDSDIEQRARLNIALSKLTRRQKQVLELSFNQRLSYENIAQRMDMNYQSVNNLVFRAIRRLRESITPVIAACFIFF
jgi:RNA polymerase sigma-70 factor (ECF subfamily)